MKRKTAANIFLCLFSGIGGLCFGASLAILFRHIYFNGSADFLPYALYALIGGIVAFLALIITLFASRKGASAQEAGPSYFANPHPELLDEAALLKKAKASPKSGLAALTVLILSRLSDDERNEVAPRLHEILLSKLQALFPTDNSQIAFVPPSCFLFRTDKGSLQAKVEEVSRQSVSALALDPTLPDVRLMYGIEASEEAMEPETRLAHAKLASSYDAISRLSGAVLSYDKAMEIDSAGLSLDLKTAMDEGRLEITYVPLLDKNNKTYAYMRSVKLFDPGRGLIEEEELRRLAENARQSEVLDDYALDKTLDDLVEFDNGTRRHLGTMVFSVGRATFYHASWLQTLRRKAAERDIDISRLCIGIPASALENDEAYCASFAKKCHAVGVQLGFVNFSPLCPLTRVKELAPEIVSFAPSFFNQDPRLGKAKIEVLKGSAKTIESPSGNFDTIPDLYPLKEVTPSLALERLQTEEEFLR